MIGCNLLSKIMGANNQAIPIGMKFIPYFLIELASVRKAGNVTSRKF